MKKLWIISVFLTTMVVAEAQSSVSDYFEHQGCSTLATCAHILTAQNPFYWKFENYDDYVVVYVYYRYHSYNNTYDGPLTIMKVGKGWGGLYFDKVEVISESKSGFFPPFMGFGLGSAAMAALIEVSDPKTYRSMRQQMIQYLKADPNNWDGADWTLFALNLDYANYVLNR